MRLILATHAETDWTRAGRYQGHTDIPLSEPGLRQAALLRQALTGERIEWIVSSDLGRARQTAESIASGHDRTVALEPRLRELHFGAWEGLTFADLQRDHAQAWAAWRANPLQSGPPGGETLDDVKRRLEAFLGDLARRPEQAVLLVGHRGAWRVLLCLLLGIPVERHWQFHLNVASISELDWTDGQTRLLRWNESRMDFT